MKVHKTRLSPRALIDFSHGLDFYVYSFLSAFFFKFCCFFFNLECIPAIIFSDTYDLVFDCHVLFISVSFLLLVFCSGTNHATLLNAETFQQKKQKVSRVTESLT